MISEPGTPKTRVFQTLDPKIEEKCPRDLQIWHNSQLCQFADFAEVVQNLCEICIIAKQNQRVVNYSKYSTYMWIIGFPHFAYVQGAIWSENSGQNLISVFISAELEL